MRIFQNKLPRAWKSTGITIVDGQLEMSNFSFGEEIFKSTSNKFTINIIGKNIIGNGSLLIKIYKEKFLVWQEELSFKGASFSKKTVEIEEESGREFRVVLSRGRESKGKILINSVMISQQATIKEDPGPQIQPEVIQEDEPTFATAIEDNKEKESILLNEKTEKIDTIDKKAPSIKHIVQKKRKQKKEKITTKIGAELQEEPIISSADETTAIESLTTNIVAQQYTVELEQSVLEVLEEKKKKNNIWVHIIDFSTVDDERDVFKYVNQISFGRGKQIFLIKKNDDLEVDLSKYDYVNIFNENSNIEEKLVGLNPEKITFLEQNLNEELLSFVKKIKEK
jgi:hypothetical protein